MKAFFLAGVILGLVVALGAARFYPWVDHPRSASLTTVVHNGGRVEEFVIRFPVDRIASVGSAEMGLRARGYPQGIELPGEMEAQPVLVEHFKLRDRDGEVIGVAARHAAVAAGEANSAWALTIPSRGTMHLLGTAEPGALDRELAAAGRVDGRAWSGALELSIGSPEAETGRVSGGSHEFEDLVGTYREDWQVSGVSQAGELRGTIMLRTTSEIGG